MLSKPVSTLLIVLAITVLFAWSPWLTEPAAETRALNSFNHAWKSVVDGCGTNCRGCGAVASQRVPFGVLVTVEYVCGLIPADLPEYHLQSTAFVSPLGSVHGFTKP